MKNTKSKIESIKVGKQPGTTYCLGCKDYTQNFRLQEVKMTNKVLRESSIYKGGYQAKNHKMGKPNFLIY